MTQPTSAVVLAAGEGSRLRPLTKYKPKPMLPVANRPIVDYVVDALQNAAITDIVMVVGHQHRRLQDHLNTQYPDLELTYIRQPHQLGSGDALAQAAGEVSGEFVVVNGDNIIDAAMVTGAIDQYERASATATVAVGRSERSQDYGTVCLENGRVTTILEADTDSEQGRINVGVYVFDEQIFDALEETSIQAGELSLTDAISQLPGPIVPAVPEGVWFDPAYPWDLLSISERLQSAQPGLVTRPEQSRIDETARIHDGAVLAEGTIVGPGCEIAAGAVLGNGTCLQSDVRIGENTVVKRSQVGADSRVGANAVLRDTVVGAEVSVGDGATAPGGPADFAVCDRVHTARQLGSVVSDRATVGANVTLSPGTQIGPGVTVSHGTTVSGGRCEQEVIR